MNNKLKLILLSITPFVFGNSLNLLILKLGWYGFPVLIISILFCIYWFIAGSYSSKYSDSIIEATLISNSFGIISIGLLLFSVAFFGAYLPGLLGAQAQMYFMPLIGVTSILLAMTGIITTNAVYLVSFVIMVLTFVIGYKVGNRQRTEII